MFLISDSDSASRNFLGDKFEVIWLESNRFLGCPQCLAFMGTCMCVCLSLSPLVMRGSWVRTPPSSSGAPPLFPLRRLHDRLGHHPRRHLGVDVTVDRPPRAVHLLHPAVVLLPVLGRWSPLLVLGRWSSCLYKEEETTSGTQRPVQTCGDHLPNTGRDAAPRADMRRPDGAGHAQV